MGRSLQLIGNISEYGVICFPAMFTLNQWKMDHKGKNIRVTFEEYSGQRTAPQNRYYWGVIVETIKSAINDLGNSYTADEIHDFLKKEFNYSEVETIDGHFLKVPESTTNLDTIAFNEYKERIQQFAAEVLNIYIPDPNESEIEI